MFNFKSILTLRRQVDDRATELRREIAELEAKRQSLNLAAVSRLDVRAAIQSRTRENGEAFVTATRERLAGLAWEPHGLGDDRRVGLLGKAADEKVTAGDLERALAALFPSQVAAALAAAVDGAAWPDKEGLPAAQRQAEVQRLDAEIGTRQEELRKLLNEAREAGLDV